MKTLRALTQIVSVDVYDLNRGTKNFGILKDKSLDRLLEIDYNYCGKKPFALKVVDISGNRPICSLITQQST